MRFRPLLWVPMGGLRALTILLGFVVVPLMLACNSHPRWLFRPWLNPETGLSGAPWWEDYLSRHGNPVAKKFPRFWWSAIRNPANGLRTYDFLTVEVKGYKFKGNDLPVNPAELRKLKKRVGWFYAWKGIYSGFWVCVVWNETRHMKLRIGWKIVPDYLDEWIPEIAGYALAFLPWRKG